MNDPAALEEDASIGLVEGDPPDPYVPGREPRALPLPMSARRRSIAAALFALGFTAAIVAFLYRGRAERDDLVLGFILLAGIFCFGGACAWLGKPRAAPRERGSV